VRYKEQDLTVYKDSVLTRYRRENVGFVFQFYNLIPSLTARENVALVTEIATNPLTPRKRSGWSDLATDSTIFRPSCPEASSSG
jgi:ABC-type lipoprotein export system ATPase subunit